MAISTQKTIPVTRSNQNIPLKNSSTCPVHQRETTEYHSYKPFEEAGKFRIHRNTSIFSR